MTIVCGSLQNFRFNGGAYRIVNAGTKGGQAYASVEPHDPTFHSYLLAHINKYRTIRVETGGYPESFQCFAGNMAEESKLLLEQRGKQGN